MTNLPCKAATLALIFSCATDNAVLGVIEEPSLNSTVLNTGEPNLWPGGVIPYQFQSGHWDATFTDRDTFDYDTCSSLIVVPTSTELDTPTKMCTMLRSIFRAMDEWERNTPVTFVEHGSQSHWIRFKSGNDNCRYNAGVTWPHVGRGTTNNIVQTGGCSPGNPFQLAHELGHAAGFEHEQSRSDRNSYIDYDHRCLPQQGGQHFNYDISGSNLGPVGPFDLKSLMMYSSYSNVRDATESDNPNSVALYTDALGNDRLLFDVGCRSSHATRRASVEQHRVAA